MFWCAFCRRFMLKRKITPSIIKFDPAIKSASPVGVFVQCQSIFSQVWIRTGTRSRTSPIILTPCSLSTDWIFWLEDEHKPSAFFGFCVLCGSLIINDDQRTRLCFHSNRPENMSWKGNQSPPVGAGHLKVRVSLWCWSVSSLVSWYIQCLHVVFSESGLVNSNTHHSQHCSRMSAF